MPYAQNINCDGSIGKATENIVENNPASIKDLTIKSIYPNPVQNVLTATVNSTRQIKVRIYITDVSGNVMKQYQQNINAGNNALQLNVNSLNAGSYFIKVLDGTASAAVIFYKQ